MCTILLNILFTINNIFNLSEIKFYFICMKLYIFYITSRHKKQLTAHAIIENS